MLDAAPGQIGDVQQAVDAAQVDERAVVGDVLDDALDHGAFGQGLQQRLRALRPWLASSTARRDTTTLLRLRSSLMTLNSILAFERRRVLDRADIHQRTRQEGADAVDHDGQAALDLAADHARDERRLFPGPFPGPSRRRGAWPCRATGVVSPKPSSSDFDGDLDEIADLDFEFAAIVAEFFDGDEAFGLQSGVDDDEIRRRHGRLRR